MIQLFALVKSQSLMAHLVNSIFFLNNPLMSHLYLDDFPIYKSSNDITIGIKIGIFPFIITLMSPMPSLDGEIPSG